VADHEPDESYGWRDSSIFSIRADELHGWRDSSIFSIRADEWHAQLN
jgi:hypothetical protein